MDNNLIFTKIVSKMEEPYWANKIQNTQISWGLFKRILVELKEEEDKAAKKERTNSIREFFSIKKGFVLLPTNVL